MPLLYAHNNHVVGCIHAWETAAMLYMGLFYRNMVTNVYTAHMFYYTTQQMKCLGAYHDGTNAQIYYEIKDYPTVTATYVRRFSVALTTVSSGTVYTDLLVNVYQAAHVPATNTYYPSRFLYNRWNSFVTHVGYLYESGSTTYKKGYVQSDLSADTCFYSLTWSLLAASASGNKLISTTRSVITLTSIASPTLTSNVASRDLDLYPFVSAFTHSSCNQNGKVSLIAPTLTVA